MSCFDNPGDGHHESITLSAESIDGNRLHLKKIASCRCAGSVEATAEWLAREVRSGDAVLVLGGGRSYRIAERLLEFLRERQTGRSGDTSATR